jgi:hypothetical protein
VVVVLEDDVLAAGAVLPDGRGGVLAEVERGLERAVAAELHPLIASSWNTVPPSPGT